MREVGSRHPAAVANPAPAGDAVHVRILNHRAIRRNGLYIGHVAAKTGVGLANCPGYRTTADRPTTQPSIIIPGVGIAPVVRHSYAGSYIISTPAVIVAV